MILYLNLGAYFDKADSMGYSLSDYMSFGSVTATCLVIIVNAQVHSRICNKTILLSSRFDYHDALLTNKCIDLMYFRLLLTLPIGQFSIILQYGEAFSFTFFYNLSVTFYSAESTLVHFIW